MKCKIHSCEGKHLALGFCSMHYARFKGKTKTPLNFPRQHPNYGTGRLIDKDGYYQIKIDGKYRREHRVIMENKIGRKLNRDELVHHINNDKKDNRPENLELMNFRDHARLHHQLLPNEIQERIIGLYKHGVPVTEIGRYVPLSESAIRKYLLRNGIKLRGIFNRNLTKEQ